VRCPRCDHPVQFCECLTPPPSPEPEALLVDLGWGRPYRIRHPSPLRLGLLVAALLAAPLLLLSLPLVGVLTFWGHPGDPVCVHQVLGFLVGSILAVLGAWAVPLLVVRALGRPGIGSSGPEGSRVSAPFAWRVRRRSPPRRPPGSTPRER
jgi:hypothetical protein